MFGRRLEELRRMLGLSKTEMAKLFGISARQYLNYEKGEKPGLEKLKRLAEKVPSLNIRWLITGEGSPFEEEKFLEAREYDVAGEKNPIKFSDSFVRVLGIQPSGNLSFVRMKGDSMEPLIPDKALVFYEKTDKGVPIQDGAIYILLYKGKIFIRRVEEIPEGKIRLHPENRKYSTIELEISFVEIVGCAVAFMRSL